MIQHHHKSQETGKLSNSMEITVESSLLGDMTD